MVCAALNVVLVAKITRNAEVAHLTSGDNTEPPAGSLCWLAEQELELLAVE